MGHDHSHHHPTHYNRAFAIGVILNLGFVIIEATYGVLADSLALIADAGHNLSDVASLLLAWGASILAGKASTARRTYGFRKVTVLASLISSLLLLFALGAIAWEAVNRFMEPAPVAGETVIIVAAIGVVVNTLTALLFARDQHHDLNIRAAFLHMAADAAISLGVVVAGVIILFQGWLWVDPVVSLLIVTVIFFSTWGLLRESTNYAIDAVPKEIDSNEIQQYLLSQPPVRASHDLHIWPLSTTEVALTVHLVVADSTLDNTFLWRLQQNLKEHFGIDHATIQLEAADRDLACLLDRRHCH